MSEKSDTKKDDPQGKQSVVSQAMSTLFRFLILATNKVLSFDPVRLKTNAWADTIDAEAKRAPLSIDAKAWAAIWGISLLLASILYASLVLVRFNILQESLLEAQPTEVEFLTGLQACPAPNDAPTDAAKFYGKAFGASDDKVLLQLNRALCSQEGAFNKIPVLALVSHLIRQDRQCGGDNCSVECSGYWQRRIARLLGGSPRDSNTELSELPTPPGRDLRSQREKQGKQEEQEKQGLKSCSIPEPWLFLNPLGFIWKPDPTSAPEVARWLLGTQKCVSSDDRDLCTLITRLLQSSVDNPKVRAARTWVNMIWGGERLAVITLCFVMSLAIFYRYMVRRNLDEQKRELLEHVFKQGAGPFESGDLREWFEGKFPQSEDNEDFTPIRNLLKASTLVEAEARARLDTELIGQSRLALDALITVFPVIGFVATLWGLIVALSSANLIASSIGDERNANVLRVTSELSSCFSTTLLALVAMTLFAILNILQAKRELALVTDVQDCFMPLLGGASPSTVKPRLFRKTR